MSKKYVQNLIKSTIILQDAKLNTIIRLEPHQCSFQKFEEEELLDSPYVSSFLSKKIISLQDERTQIVINEHKDYGQKFKIGSQCYLNDESSLELIIDSYDPNTKVYSAKVVKSGGILKLQEQAINLTKFVSSGKKIDIDIDEFGELKPGESDKSALPQEPEQSEVEVIRTEEKDIKSSKNADDLIKSQEKIANDISNQKVEIIYKKPSEAKKETEDEDIYLVKADKDLFAQEITASQLAENTQEAITKEIKKVSETIKSKEDKKVVGKTATIDQTAFVELSSELQEYIKEFMTKDSRVKKIVISKCKDIDKLTAISKCADDLSMKAAKTKLEKLDA